MIVIISYFNELDYIILFYLIVFCFVFFFIVLFCVYVILKFIIWIKGERQVKFVEFSGKICMKMQYSSVISDQYFLFILKIVVCFDCMVVIVGDF